MSKMKLVLPRFPSVAVASDYLRGIRQSLHRSQKDATRYAYRVLAGAENLSELRPDMLRKQGKVLTELDSKLRVLDAMRLQLTYTLRGEQDVGKILQDISTLQGLILSRYNDVAKENSALAKNYMPDAQSSVLTDAVDAIKAALRNRVAKFSVIRSVGTRNDMTVFGVALVMNNLVDDDRFVHPEFALNFEASFEGDTFKGYQVSGSVRVERPEYAQPGSVSFTDVKDGVASAFSILARGNFLSVAPKVPLPTGLDENALKKSKRYVKSITTNEGTISVSLKPSVKKDKLATAVKRLVEDIVGVISNHLDGQLKYQTKWKGTSYKVDLHLMPPENKKTLTVESLKALEDLGFTDMDLQRLVTYLNNGDVKWRK